MPVCAQCNEDILPEQWTGPSWCKPCTKAYFKEYRDTHKDAYREYDRKWREENPSSIREARERYRQNNQEAIRESQNRCYAAKPEQYRNSRSEWRKSNPERVAFHNAKHKYGISFEEWSRLLKLPCEICGSTEKLCIDHDHVTDVVRGRLCNSCNTGLGAFKDNPSLLQAAMKYLERSS